MSFKQIKAWFFSLFKKQEEKTEDIPVETIQQIKLEEKQEGIPKKKKTNEPLGWERFGEANDIQQGFFEILQPCDIVLAHIPNTEEECAKKNIGENHRIRPYIVVKKTEHGFWGYPGTSNGKYFNNPCVMVYSSTLSELPKTTYFNPDFYTWIPTCHIQDQVDILPDIAKAKMQKAIFNTRATGNKHMPLLQDVEIPHQEGEILRAPDKSQWIIYSAWGDTYYMYLVSANTKTGDLPINIQKNVHRYVHVGTQRVATKQELCNYTTVWYCNERTVREIQEKKKQNKRKGK